MKIIDLDDSKTIENTAVALGNFDGIHIGHQKLIEQVKIEAKKKNLSSSILLFKSHTRASETMRYLTSLEDKINILDNYKLDLVFLIDFSTDFKSLSAEEFISNILHNKLNAKSIIVGNDYKFGKKAKGDITTLLDYKDKYQYKLKIIDDVLYEGDLVSSTMIKDELSRGDLAKANKLLDRYYFIRGKVIKGYGRGKKIGYPTANIDLDFNYVIPKEGVYYTLTEYKGVFYDSLTSIGYNPTFDNPVNSKTIEVYIDCFSKDIYKEELSLFFVKYLRPMIKFPDVNGLISQLDNDYASMKDLSVLYN